MKRPLYSQVVDDLRQQIRDGELLDRVPPETELASSFQVSVSTVKKALGILEAEDIVVRIQGRGTFVRSEAQQVLQLSGGVKEPEHAREQATVEVPQRATDKSSVVGVILPEARDGFARRLLSGVIGGISDTGASALVDFSGGDRERESKIVAKFLQAGVDGMIVLPGYGEMYNRDFVQLSFERFPLVFVDRWFPGIDISRVVSQNANGVMEAVNALHAAGHRNMALVCADLFATSTESIVERTKGFLEGLKNNGVIPTDEALWIPEFRAETALQDAQNYVVDKLRRYPEVTAIVGVSTLDVQIALEAAYVVGRSVPNDLSIAGFDVGSDFSNFGRLFGGRAEDFPVAWIDQSELVIGQEAAGVVSRLIAGSATTEVIEVPAKFHWGRTCGPAPAFQETGQPVIEATTSLLRRSLTLKD